MTSLFLRSNIQVEPLFDRWYAWPHLIPPATAARNLTERHLKIMESYISAPQVHVSAASNPKMLGGPFIDYPQKRVPEIAALKASTTKKRAGLVKLSGDLELLDALLRDNGNGYSLEPLYARVPDSLKGYVELVYDRNHNADFRIIEPLIYRSEHYEKSAQSLMLSEVTSDDRPFVLSTPRLDSANSVHLEMSFDRAEVDELFRLKTSPRPWHDICDALPVDRSALSLFRSFFTETPPDPYRPYRGAGVRWRYFGHACILVETKDVSILFDPVLSYSYSHGIPRYTYEDLPDKIDYAVITHNHQDHVLLETLLQIRHKVEHVVVPRSGKGLLQDPSLRLILMQCGFHNVIELDDMEDLKLPTGVLVALPFLGEHADLNIATKSAYLVRLGQHSLLFAADSCNIEPHLYTNLQREIGDVDALFIGMECEGAPLSWLYGPLITRPLERSADRSRRLSGSNHDQASSIVDQFHCREVFVYAMGQEPWLNYIMSIKYDKESRPIVESEKLLEYCRKSGIVAERLFGEREILLESAVHA